MAENFTAKQREVIARKMGYDGPMQGFDMFLNSSPALASKFNSVTDKYVAKMANGGLIEKLYLDKLGRPPDAVGLAHWSKAFGTDLPGGEVDKDELKLFEEAAQAERTARGIVNYPTIDLYKDNQFAAYVPPVSNLYTPGVQAPTPMPAPAPAPSSVGGAFNTPGIPQGGTAIVPVTNAPAPAPAKTAPVTGGVTGGGDVTYTAIGGKPIAGDPASISPALTAEAPNQIITGTLVKAPETASKVGTTSQATKATDAVGTGVAAGSMVAGVRKPAEEYTYSGAATGLETKLNLVDAAEGEFLETSKLAGQTATPTTNAVAAAKTSKGTDVVAPTVGRTISETEKVSGTSVDKTTTDAALALNKLETAQGTVTEDMTVQGQLNKLLVNFDAGKPPTWAQATMRTATATLAARGLGASSLAGQAIVQAALEAAMPIAAADAKVYEQMGLQNLSNKQQTAVLLAQQRAAFIGQDFDQAFQAKVLNAAKVSDIANITFSAAQQIALENARIANTMDLASLSNQQATALANAATYANMELAGLNNKQQAAVFNAKAFLDMDMKNLDNEQQTTLFKAQQITTALLSDAASENAAKQFNASSTNQASQFNASLAAQVSQFNNAQENALKQFNTDQTNSIAKFNAEAQNLRDNFNSNQRLVIDQSNAQWRREISTANTAATNATNYINAQNLQAMTLAEYNNATQLYRDQIEMAWSSYEKDADRAVDIIKSQIVGGATTSAAKSASDAALWKSVGEVATKFATKYFDLD
jgi:hypothetical protein